MEPSAPRRLTRPEQNADVQQIVDTALDAIVRRDWDAVRRVLHPYLHWIGADGRTIRGRSKVMAMLEQASDTPDLPSSVELRDEQIYRWHA